MTIAERLRAFIKENFYAAHKLQLGDHDSLLDRGVIDSTGVLELVAFLEQEFGIRVHDEEIVPEHLDSIACVIQFVERKRGRAA
jgi:acyl carrier protein